jgi:hypothetical protein
LKGYDEPEILLYPLSRNCLIGPEPGQLAEYQAYTNCSNVRCGPKLRKLFVAALPPERTWVKQLEYGSNGPQTVIP